MSEIVQQDDNELPPVIELNHPLAYDVWVLWRATDRKFLPSQIMEENEALLNDMITLDSVYEAIRKKHDANSDN